MTKWLKPFYKYGTPIHFYHRTAAWLPWLAIAWVVTLIAGVYWGLFIAPMDYQQRDAFRIIYLHVPCAMLSLSIYTMLGVSSIIYLIWRVKLADMFAPAIAPLGAGFTLLALITGSIWGKPMWGTWWIWDARLTSELILLFLYLGYMGLRNTLATKAAVPCAILAVVGLVDVPIIHYSVQWWQTLHQGSTIMQWGKPSIETGMLVPLIMCIVGGYLFFFYCALYKIRQEILNRERQCQWVQQIFNVNKEPNVKFSS